jgi:hypothetical protein
VDGRQIGQANAIVRFLSRKYKLAGDNEIEEGWNGESLAISD